MTVPETQNSTVLINYSLEPLSSFFSDTIDPQEMAIYLEEIETQYLSYLLRFPELPGQTAEHQIHYLRRFRKALSKVNLEER
tara:strand:+ start:121 stop:366 length:246 start_codon:yes stop_codon:yes gene_type:complete